jgi:isohexenylglutaconyl-CoA hydratase
MRISNHPAQRRRTPVSQQNLDTLLLERKGAVLHVRLNRPEVRNAMSQVMLRELLDALRQAENTEVRLVVLRGMGGHFSAGADIKDMSTARAGAAVEGNDPIADLNASFGHMCAAFAQTPLAVIAVVEGAVMGGGFGLACTADVTIASKTVEFRLPETSLGLVPAQIAPFLVERVGYGEAKRLAVTGARFGSAEAFRIGLVHHVCENESELDAVLAATIEQILACAPGAIAETKKLLRRGRSEDPASFVDDAAAVFARGARGEEGAEGLSAFLEKRKAAWAIT